MGHGLTDQGGRLTRGHAKRGFVEGGCVKGGLAVDIRAVDIRALDIRAVGRSTRVDRLAEGMQRVERPVRVQTRMLAVNGGLRGGCIDRRMQTITVMMTIRYSTDDILTYLQLQKSLLSKQKSPPCYQLSKALNTSFIVTMREKGQRLSETI